jgi:hypothetical protein
MLVHKGAPADTGVIDCGLQNQELDGRSVLSQDQTARIKKERHLKTGAFT